MKKRYTVWMSFEANVEIEAASEKEALEKAHTVLDWHHVVNDENGKRNDDFYPQEPNVVEVHKT